MPLKDLNDITVATYQNNFQKYKDSTALEVTGELKDWIDSYDGYIADAVLLHAPQHIFEQALRYMHIMLKKGGVAMIVLKDGMGQEMTIDKLGTPRYFKYQNEESLRTAFAKMPFEILEILPSVPKKWIKVIVRAL